MATLRAPEVAVLGYLIFGKNVTRKNFLGPYGLKVKSSIERPKRLVSDFCIRFFIGCKPGENFLTVLFSGVSLMKSKKKQKSV